MGQAAHKLYCSYKEKERRANRVKSYGYGIAEDARKDAEIARLQYEAQQRVDDDDFKRGLDLLNRYEY